MDNAGRQIYEYFLPTDGISMEQARRDLSRVFHMRGESYDIKAKAANGTNGLYVRATLKLSKEGIAGLAGLTSTPLERLRRVETRTPSLNSSTSLDSHSRPSISPPTMPVASAFAQNTSGYSNSNSPKSPRHTSITSLSAANMYAQTNVQVRGQQQSTAMSSTQPQHMTTPQTTMHNRSLASPQGQQQHAAMNIYQSSNSPNLPSTIYDQSAAMPQQLYQLTSPLQNPNMQSYTPVLYSPETTSYSASQLYNQTGNTDPRHGPERSPPEIARQRQRTHSSGDSISPSQNSMGINDAYYFQPRVVSSAEIQNRRNKMKK